MNTQPTTNKTTVKRKSAKLPTGARCAHCGGKANRYHHTVYVCQGNTEKPDLPLCNKCHTSLHSNTGDWKTWGSIGGQRTASNPDNWKRNLKQFKTKGN